MDSLKNRDADKVKELTDIIKQVSSDLVVYSEQFQRASKFLDYSIKK